MAKKEMRGKSIEVTLWEAANKFEEHRKKLIADGKQKNYRNRESEILFVDLRRWGTEYEKQFIEILPEDITRIAQNYHNWQQTDSNTSYKNMPEYCYSASLEQIQANDFTLVPSYAIEL